MKILIEYGESYYEATPEFPEYFKRKGHEVVLFPSGPEKIRALKKERLPAATLSAGRISESTMRFSIWPQIFGWLPHLVRDMAEWMWKPAENGEFLWSMDVVVAHRPSLSFLFR